MQRGFLARSVCRFNHADSDANLFSAFWVNAKACSGLLPEVIFRLWRLNDIVPVCSFRLLPGVHIHLAAVDNNVHVCFLAIISAGVVSDCDCTVWPYYKR